MYKAVNLTYFCWHSIFMRIIINNDVCHNNCRNGSANEIAWWVKTNHWNIYNPVTYMDHSPPLHLHRHTTGIPHNHIMRLADGVDLKYSSKTHLSVLTYYAFHGSRNYNSFEMTVIWHNWYPPLGAKFHTSDWQSLRINSLTLRGVEMISQCSQCIFKLTLRTDILSTVS